MSGKECAALTCPCGCGKIVRYWHIADCPDDCNIEGNDEYRDFVSTPTRRPDLSRIEASEETT